MAGELPQWYQFLCKHADGLSPRMWALLDHLADLPEAERGPRTGSYLVPGARFTITSDGHAMIDFQRQNGERHLGAYFGTWIETLDNLANLGNLFDQHGTRCAGYSGALFEAIKAKVGTDYRDHSARKRDKTVH